MGTKTSRIEGFYRYEENDPKDLIDKMIKTKVKGANIALKSLSAETRCSSGGPTLIFRECWEPYQMDKLVEESRRLRANELMVVLTSAVNPWYSKCTSLVQLLCKRKGKDNNITLSEADTTGIPVVEEFLIRGVREGAHSEEVSASSKEAPASSAMGEAPIVPMAYGDHPDTLLRDAVKFVEGECYLRLVQSSNIWESRPLLVFCKNNTKLQEDIRHATEETRDGMDVMLLIVTDREELVLKDTDATQNLGAKSCLLFNQHRQKFRSLENEQTMKWIGKFLERYQIEVTLRLQRGSSLRRISTWRRSFRKSEETGPYLVFGELSEEQLKNIILFFDDLKVRLYASEQGYDVSPLVILCSVNQHPDQCRETVLKSCQDLRDVYVVIIHRLSEEVSTFERFPDLNGGSLATKDVSATVPDNSQNRKLVDRVRKFLKNMSSAQRRHIPKVDQIYRTSESVEEAGSSAVCTTADRGHQEDNTVDHDYVCVPSPDGSECSRGESSPPPLASGTTRTYHLQEPRPPPQAHDHSPMCPVYVPRRYDTIFRRSFLPVHVDRYTGPEQPSENLSLEQPSQAPSRMHPPHYHRSRQPSAHSFTFRQTSEQSSGGGL